MNRTDKRRTILGLALLILVAVAIFLIDKPPICEWLRRCPDNSITVTGLACGSKKRMLANEEVKRILLVKYNIGKVDCETAESSVCREKEKLKDKDFVWPGAVYWVEVCNATTGRNLKYDQTFQTPIVFYSWGCVTDELVKRGQVTRAGGVYYIPDMLSFTNALLAGAKWQGECGTYARLLVIPTDPTKSSSGLEFVVLLAGVLNGNEIVDEITVEPLLPRLRNYIWSLGKLEDTSGKLFPNCKNAGMGECPIFTVYESQGIDYIKDATPEDLKTITDSFRTLYPKPTVMAAHVIIALTPKGELFMQAMKDTEIQAIAWKNHGFRTGSHGVNDPSAFGFSGVPAEVFDVIRVPNNATMDCISNYLKLPPPLHKTCAELAAKQ